MSRALSSDFITNPQWTIFNEPLLGFGRTMSEDIQFPIEGLQRFGPYDKNMRKRRFDNLEIVVIETKDSNTHQQIELILENLVDGLGYYRGLRKEFRLSEEPKVTFETTEDDVENLSEWTKVLQNQKQYSLRYEKDGKRVVTLVGGHDHKSLAGTEHYYTTKRELLRLGIPNQYLSKHDTESELGILQQNPLGSGFVYAVWNVALALYVKAGGFPWVLKESNIGEMDVDSVSGLRFARDKNEDGYVIGALSVFGSHGILYGTRAQRFVDASRTGDTWIGRSRGMFVGEEDAFTLGSIILERHEEQNGSLPNHVVIHRLGQFHEREISGLVQLLESKEVEKFSFLEVFSSGNPRIFEDDHGTPSSTRRGLAIEIAKDAAIVCTTGNSHYDFRGYPQLKKHYMGTPKPIVVKIRKSKNSFTSPLAAASNIFNLTALHWGCGWSKEIQLPVTLDFAQNIARLYANGIVPHNLLEETAWFV